ncbi:MAG: class I SAM-dependent methyltransferase, partial [Thermoflexales bacterium]
MKFANWLLPYDLFERHYVVARWLADHGLRDANLRVLDVGGRAGLLGRFTPCSVISANVDRSGDVRCDGMALPFPNAAFDIAVAIDTLEHMPRERRPAFVRECLRVSRKAVILAAPFGSPGHAEAEARLHALFQALTG